MNRQKRFAIIGLAIGAAAVAGWFGLQTARSQPIAGAMKVAAFAVSAAEAPESAATTAATTHELPQHNPDLDNAKQLLQDGKKVEARAALTKLILPAPEGPVREEMRKMLDAINKELFFSSKPSPDSITYEVQPGDTLAVIAHNQTKDSNQSKDYYFTEVIMLVNGVKDARRIRPGKVLKIPQGTFSAIVQKDAHRLIILLDGNYIKEYPVALGAPESPTPEGKFVLDVGKARDPDWTDSDGHLYKFGDPKNVLGTRWMPFNDTEGHHGLGIHGTTDPASVGKDVSDGCIRMLNADVEEIFGMLAPGDTVEITK
ncbi:MAG: L,D-transpeptidase family protein [Candidatus Brocadiia bacterium]|jgi:lipoprotein-anchoring transpeptidase ErfK/SrfK